VKGFTRWLVNEGKIDRDSLASLRLLNEKTDVRRQRRAFTADELKRLLDITQQSKKSYRGKTWKFSPEDRAMLYRLAVMTGLRAGELSLLTVNSFDLEAKTLTVEASFSKRRRKDVLPLHTSLVERLRSWLTTKTDYLFPGRWMAVNIGGKIIKRDMKRAKIERVDDRGRVLDFHALRHTFITQLAKSGVHPSKAKELARHSTITLTMDVYSHCETEELRTALDSVPGLD
jgi:integrase